MTSSETSHLIPRASLSDAVYQRLRDEIMHGSIADGSRLSQVQLAERYGVSRIPIREALRRLQAESLVIATPYHPFVVRNVTAAQVLELVDVRAALEDLALSRREPLSAATIAELRKLNQQMARGKEGAEFLGLDRRLHQIIAGPDTMTVAIIDDVRDKIHRYLQSMASGKTRRTAAAQEHGEIINAIEARDTDLARRLMHDHVMKSRQLIVDRLAAEASASDPAQVPAASGAADGQRRRR